MPHSFDPNRRFLLSAAALTAVSLQLGAVSAAHATAASGSVKLPGSSPLPLQHIRAGVLEISYADLGPIDGPAVLLLHGWPYDIYSYADVAEVLKEQGYRVLIPYLRGYGSTRFLSQKTPRNGQQSAFAVDMIAFLDALKIEKAILGGFDWGARTVNIMAALWPDRCKAMVSVSGYLIGSQAANSSPLPPKAELAWWYQFYFATERGQRGYAQNTRDFNKLIWQLTSPQWVFDNTTFDRTAKAFDNPDHVAITIDNYRWRLGLTRGEKKFDTYEAKLATTPKISIPTITMEGAANGAPHPNPASYAKMFTGKYEHRNVEGGVGHNLPQEAPLAFAQAVIDVARF